ARALYSAPLLPDIYDEWIVVRRVALQQKFDTVLEQRAQIAEEAGDLPAAREIYQILAANDPFYEASWRGLMRSLARMGYFRDALDAYERLAKLLDDEIGAP